MVVSSTVLVQFLNGLAQAMLLILIASGLSIIFGLMDVLNFAHGAFYMLGAYSGVTVYLATGQFWLAIVVAFVLIGVLGALLEYVTLRRLYDRDPAYHLLITFGFLLIIEQGVRIIWGSSPRSLDAPALLEGSIQLLNTSYPVYRLFILVFGAVFTIALFLLIRYSNIGLIVRAGTYDTETVRMLGINLPRIFTLTFAFGIGLAAMSGIVAAPMVGLSPTMGDQILIDAFIVVIIGGLGSFRGVVVASIIIAEIQALGVLVLPRFTPVLILLAVIVMLVIRPQGLFGTVAEGGSK